MIGWVAISERSAREPAYAVGLYQIPPGYQPTVHLIAANQMNIYDAASMIESVSGLIFVPFILVSVISRVTYGPKPGAPQAVNLKTLADPHQQSPP